MAVRTYPFLSRQLPLIALIARAYVQIVYECVIDSLISA